MVANVFYLLVVWVVAFKLPAVVARCLKCWHFYILQMIQIKRVKMAKAPAIPASMQANSRAYFLSFFIISVPS